MTESGQNGTGLGENDIQFVSEGQDVKPNPNRQKLREAVERASLQGRDAENVNAVQVNMDRSGAEHVEAQRVTLANSGAR